MKSLAKGAPLFGTLARGVLTASTNVCLIPLPVGYQLERTRALPPLGFLFSEKI